GQVGLSCTRSRDRSRREVSPGPDGEGYRPIDDSRICGGDHDKDGLARLRWQTVNVLELDREDRLGPLSGVDGSTRINEQAQVRGSGYHSCHEGERGLVAR